MFLILFVMIQLFCFVFCTTMFSPSVNVKLLPDDFIYFLFFVWTSCRLLRNSSRGLVDPDFITYYLYMRVGFENLCINDRVFVTVPPSIPTVGGKKSKKRHLSKHQAQLMAYDSKEAYFDDQCRRYPAEISKVWYVYINTMAFLELLLTNCYPN